MSDEIGKRDPKTWPKWCCATRIHPLTRDHQRCMEVGPHSRHLWETS